MGEIRLEAIKSREIVVKTKLHQFMDTNSQSSLGIIDSRVNSFFDMDKKKLLRNSKCFQFKALRLTNSSFLNVSSVAMV